jgi:hypothetical protein
VRRSGKTAVRSRAVTPCAAAIALPNILPSILLTPILLTYAVPIVIPSRIRCAQDTVPCCRPRTLVLGTFWIARAIKGGAVDPLPCGVACAGAVFIEACVRDAVFAFVLRGAVTAIAEEVAWSFVDRAIIACPVPVTTADPQRV